MLLKVEDASVHYKKVQALKGISLEVPDGAIVTIIGGNGAGKSTTLRAISGLVKLSGGAIWLGDRRIDGTPPETIVAAGIGHVPEGRRVFPDLTVEENLRTGAFLRRGKAKIESDLQMVFEHFPRLLDRSASAQPASSSRRRWIRSVIAMWTHHAASTPGPGIVKLCDNLPQIVKSADNHREIVGLLDDLRRDPYTHEPSSATPLHHSGARLRAHARRLRPYAGRKRFPNFCQCL